MKQPKDHGQNFTASRLFPAMFDVSQSIRYVALLQDGKLDKMERPGLSGASSSESDKYEELIVNPTLITLLRQRGNIDCGGLEYVIIRYGNFFQYVRPIPGGHISVAFETTCDYVPLLPRIEKLLSQ